MSADPQPGAAGAPADAPASTLGHKIREAASHTIIYGFGSVAQAALGFLLLPLYTHFYSTDRFGAFSLITVCATLAGAVFFLGASSALARSYYDYPTTDERRVVVTTSLSIAAFGSILQVLLGVLFGGAVARAVLGDSSYAPHVALALAGSAFGFVSNVLFVVLRNERRSTAVIALNIASLLATAALVYVFLVVCGMGVMAPILAAAIVQGAQLVALLILCRRGLTLRISRRELGLQLKFGIPTVMTGLVYYLLDSADRFLVTRYASLSDVGVYSLGYKVGMVVHLLFIIPFSQIWAPMRMEYRAHVDADDLLTTVVTYYLMAGLLCAVVVSVFAREALAVIARRPEYLAAYRVVPLVMAAHVAYGLVNVVDYGIYLARKVTYYVYILLGALALNVGMNVLLIPRFGYVAAAVTTLISYVVVAAVVFGVAHRLHPMRVERRASRIVGSAAAALAAGAALSARPGGWVLLAKLSVLAGLGVYWGRYVLNDRERTRLLALVRARWEAGPQRPREADRG